MITEHLSHLDYLEEALERMSVEIAQRLQAEHEAITLLDTVPGIGRAPPKSSSPRSARPHPLSQRQTLGVVGGDVSRQRRERRQTPQRQDPQGQPWLRQVLIEIAHRRED